MWTTWRNLRAFAWCRHQKHPCLSFQDQTLIVFGALLLSMWQVPVYTILGTSVAFVRAHAVTPHQTLHLLEHLNFASNLLKNSTLETPAKYKCECSSRLVPIWLLLVPLLCPIWLHHQGPDILSGRFGELCAGLLTGRAHDWEWCLRWWVWGHWGFNKWGYPKCLVYNGTSL